MRANRPEGFTAHTNITKTQLPYGMSLEEILRAGSAPAPEEKTPKRVPIQTGQRVRQPVRAIAMQPRPKFKPKEQRPSVKISEFEDELDGFDFEDRPPCRQNVNVFDLEDNFHPKYNGFVKEVGRGCRNDNRPPSRHKTPPKALGLELPPKRISGEMISVDHMFQQDSPISSFETESLSNTMPISFTDEKGRKKSIGKEDVPSKIRIKPKSAKAAKNNEKVNIRMWSATGKTKGKMMDVPIIINKGERNSFSSSRRDKAKAEIEKKEVLEDKRPGYFKKISEKRASSSNKGKINMIVPFQTNLEPEFLNLFAKGEDFNF